MDAIFQNLLVEDTDNVLFLIKNTLEKYDALVLDSCDKILHEKLVVDGDVNDVIKSTMDYSRSMFLTNSTILNNERLKIKKILGLDSNILGAIEKNYDKKRINDPRVVKIMNYIHSNNGFVIDCFPYLLENYLTAYDIKEKIMENTLRAFFYLDSNSSGSKLIDQSIVDEQIKENYENV